ncbi:MAG: hypothetical protein Q9180_009569, partial [Flavoplaca navasiana]
MRKKTLMDMPSELLAKIPKFLPNRTIIQCWQVSTQLKIAFADPVELRKLLITRFGNATNVQKLSEAEKSDGLDVNDEIVRKYWERLFSTTAAQYDRLERFAPTDLREFFIPFDRPRTKLDHDDIRLFGTYSQFSIHGIVCGPAEWDRKVKWSAQYRPGTPDSIEDSYEEKPQERIVHSLTKFNNEEWRWSYDDGFLLYCTENGALCVCELQSGERHSIPFAPADSQILSFRIKK